MSASEKATEVVTDAAADVAGEIAKQAEQMENVIRSLNKIKIQFTLLGVAIGTAGGAMAGFAIAYRKAETKYSKISDDEIAEMRDHYQAKTRALEGNTQKDDLESIVTEKGYSEPRSAPPMAVPPPEIVTENEDEDEDEEESEVRNIFKEAEVVDTWDYQEELRRRSPDIPYVIHYDERNEMDYQSVTLTYYETDDVLCNERDEIVDPDKRNEIVGERNLNLFGHGSNDAAIVYVRNDKLELVFEVVRSPNSFAEEVHGFSHGAYYRGNLERMRARERDDPEE